MKYEVVIGLEVHAQLKTRSKIFCACSTEFGKPPNANTCPICLGMPGVLPVLNKKVVEYAIKACLATHCEVQPMSRFARKNYFYPDPVITATAFISPYRADRNIARETVGEGNFFEVFCDTPLAVCEERDPKGLYKKARAGEIKGFTGIDDPYEAPEKPEMVIDTSKMSPQEAAVALIEMLEKAGKISAIAE